MSNWIEPQGKINIEVPGCTEPPCSKCKFWGPVFRTDDRTGRILGLRCCWTSSSMRSDFSCFAERNSGRKENV